MDANELMEVLRNNPNAKIKLSISDTDSPNCIVRELEQSNIEIESVRGDTIIYFNMDYPLDK